MMEKELIQRDAELLEFIFERIGKIATIYDNDRLLIELANMARDIVEADRCTIWILDKKKHQLWSKVAHGINPIDIDSNTGIVGAAVRERESIILNDVHSDQRFNSKIDEESGYKTQTMIVIPMKNRQSEVVGAIQVINKKNNALFTSKDVSYLKLTSTYISETIKSTLLLEELEATQREIMHIVGIVGEKRSEETALHVKRVSKYSYLLAKAYGLDERTSIVLSDISPLHDIGKLAIDDAVLKKPGQLTEEEMAHMMMHSQFGYDMLKNSQRGLLKSAAIVAYEHHEKFDGSGYPRGLKGENIHIFGRIVALADVFDALSCERVYKKAWEPERIVEYIKNQSGKHFDPKLVDVFLDNRTEFFTIAEELKDRFE